MRSAATDRYRCLYPRVADDETFVSDSWTSIPFLSFSLFFSQEIQACVSLDVKSREKDRTGVDILVPRAGSS